ncbi:hypothetical protein Ddye_001085 [Dipteronia dyeriana]|uniref:Uncharacterized protein n=1 Tax=Dipteronia dyeriana TaxID=168575 RepID=A0AAD9XNF8_9ROSI|nr:hypothetical protein Ddye_001085 [Dipteronia dyeriana]
MAKRAFPISYRIVTIFSQALCSKEKGIDIVRKPLHYLESTFHHMILRYMVHEGDFTHRNGAGLELIYCPSFVDENLVKKYIDPGICPWPKPTQVHLMHVVHGVRDPCYTRAIFFLLFDLGNVYGLVLVQYPCTEDFRSGLFCSLVWTIARVGTCVVPMH